MRGLKKKKRRVQFALVLMPAFCLFAAAPSFGAVENRKLNGPLVAGGDVSFFQISPNGYWVVYQADQEVDEAFQIYSVPAEGGDSVRLDRRLLPGSLTENWIISPDGRRVVYASKPNTPQRRDLFSVPILGPAGDSVQLNDPDDGEVLSIQITSDSRRVIYDAVKPSTFLPILHGVPIEGPATSAVALSDQIEGTSVSAFSFAIVPAGDRVVFHGRRADTMEEVFYSVPVSGPASAAQKLTDLPDGNVFGWELSPDGRRIVYRFREAGAAEIELFSVAVDEPPNDSVRLNTLLPAFGEIRGFNISPDSSAVVYTGEQTITGVFDLHSVPIAGPADAGVRLNKPWPQFGSLFQYRISPDSAWVLYTGEQETLGVRELYRVPIGGPSDSGGKLSDSLVSGGEVITFVITADSTRVVYLASLESSDVNELYSVPIEGPAGVRIKLNRNLGTEGDVRTFRVSPDGSQVAYVADPVPGFFGDEIFRLYGVPAGGPGTAGVQLNGPLVSGGDISLDLGSFPMFTPDSSRVVYIADQETDGVDELYVSYDRPAAVRVWGTYH